MNVRMTSLGGVPLLETQGDIDHNTCSNVEAALDVALGTDSPVILLDLTEVSYIDSGGLSVLFSAARRLKEDGWLGLIGSNSNIRRLLELVGVVADPSFRLFDDRQAAQTALEQGATVG